MKFLKRIFLPIFLATIWISLSEFVRNELLVKSQWVSHYESLGLVFPSELINGAIWGIWSLLFAVLIYILSRRFSVLETTLLAWFAGFVLMWVVIWNLNVLPPRLVLAAVPLSLLESFVAAWIIDKVAPKTTLAS